MKEYHIEPKTPDHNKPKFKKICQSCVVNYDTLTEAEKREALNLEHPIQTLHPCCPTHMIIKCSCGEIEEKMPLNVIALWLRTSQVSTNEGN
jgi:hypothetical protein